MEQLLLRHKVDMAALAHFKEHGVKLGNVVAAEDDAGIGRFGRDVFFSDRFERKQEMGQRRAEPQQKFSDIHANRSFTMDLSSSITYGLPSISRYFAMIW